MRIIEALIITLKVLGLMIAVAVAAAVLIIVILCTVNVVRELRKTDKK